MTKKPAKAVSDATIEDQFKSIITQLQAHKAPFDEARTALQQSKQQIDQEYQAKVAPLIEQIKAMHADILPIDQLLSSVNTARKMKGDIALDTLANIRTRVQEMIDG